MVMATKRCPYCVEEIQEEAIKCKHCGTWLTSPPSGAASYAAAGGDTYFADGFGSPRRFTLSKSDAMWDGVLSGLGRYLGIDPTWLRILYAVGTFFTGIIPGLILYMVLSWIVPAEEPGKG